MKGNERNVRIVRKYKCKCKFHLEQKNIWLDVLGFFASGQYS